MTRRVEFGTITLDAVTTAGGLATPSERRWDIVPMILTFTFHPFDWTITIQIKASRNRHSGK